MKSDRIAQLLLELRKGGVTDLSVLNIIEKTPRELFLVKPFQSRAYENVALPIGHQQTVSQPLIVGLMTQALELSDRMKVLEIGTGSGYQSVVLAPLCRRVYTIERHPPLMRQAEERFKKLGISNITSIVGDGSVGWPKQSPFERIIVTAAAEDVPDMLLEQLAIGGKMILPIGSSESDQRLIKVTRTKTGAETSDLGPVRFVPLIAGGVSE